MPTLLYCFTVIIILLHTMLFSPSFSSSCFPSSWVRLPAPSQEEEGAGHPGYFLSVPVFSPPSSSPLVPNPLVPFHWGARGGGRTLFRRVGWISLIDGVPPGVYFMSPGRDSTGDAIRHDTGMPWQYLGTVPYRRLIYRASSLDVKLSCLLHLYRHLATDCFDVFLELETIVLMATVPTTRE